MANKERKIREEKIKKDPERHALLISGEEFLSGLNFLNPKVDIKQSTAQKTKQ